MTTQKQQTIRTYDKLADDFDTKLTLLFDLYVVPFADAFMERVRPGGSILDVGAGPGAHASYFAERGYDVLCVDLSAEMIARCRARGLRAVQMDMEELALDGQYDGIWTCASLLHVPKANAPQVLSRLEQLLAPDGTLMLAVKEGHGEGMFASDRRHEDVRFFALYTEEEARELVSGFTVEYYKRNEGAQSTFFIYMLSRK